ncbi:hypothetical protein [Bacillus phage BC-T25]|nr:hypothetical protein [Bacillus phage BC-T25]
MWDTNEVNARIIDDHKVKSDQVRVLKKKLSNSVPVGKLQEMLAWEKKFDVRSEDYMGWVEFDDRGYGQAVAAREERIKLLEKLIEQYGGK